MKASDATAVNDGSVAVDQDNAAVKRLLHFVPSTSENEKLLIGSTALFLTEAADRSLSLWCHHRRRV